MTDPGNPAPRIPAPRRSGDDDPADRLAAWERGDLDDREALLLFADLLSTGRIGDLPSSYGRFAAALIDAGFLSPTGSLLVDDRRD